MTDSYTKLSSERYGFISNLHLFSILVFICGFTFTLSAQHSVSVDSENANYTLDETINFQVNAATSGTATYEIILDKHTAPLASGELEMEAGQMVTIPFTLDRAAVVLCKVKKDGQTQIASAAISPFSLEAVEAEPEQFDAFWEEARNELANIPIDPKLSFYSESDYATTYRVNAAMIDNRRVYGYISVPKMEGPYPAVLSLPAFGSVANVVRPTTFLAEQAGALAMAISIHNTEPDVADPNAYRPNDIMSEYTNYYRYAVLACIRAIDYLHIRGDFNGELAVSGVSQGGGLALMTAGLDDRVDLLVYSNASHCEHAGKKYEDASGFPYYLNQARLIYNLSEEEEEGVVQATKYYDAIYFAERYNGPSLGFISYQDEVSPPTTTFKAFNALQGMKILMHGKRLRHEHPEEYWVGRYDALRRFLPSTQRAPWPYARKTRGYFLEIGEDQILEQGQSISLEPMLMQHEEEIVLPAEWEVLEGPAEIIFEDANSLNTTAIFNTPGTYKIQVRVWDESLLEEKSRFYSISDEITITVHDGSNLPLIVDCQESITLFTSTDVATASWELPLINSTCDGETPSITQIEGLPSNSEFPVGRTMVTYQIVDACGNETTCSFSVMVLKETLSPLEIICPEDVILYTDNEGAIGNWTLPETLSACSDTPVSYEQTEGLPLGSVFPLGDTPISYAITDACGQQQTCNFIVSVIRENLPLEIACVEDFSIYTDSTSALVNWGVPSILSACNEVEDVEIVQIEGMESGSLFPLGDTEIQYLVTDACGQEAVCSFTVSVLQNTVPSLIINCPEDMTVTTAIDVAIPTWELPEIISACASEGLQFAQTSGPTLGNPFPLGDTEISYIVTDACGQGATCSFVISVVQNDQAPLDVACPPDIVLSTINGSARPDWELPEVFSSCGEGVQYIQTQGPELGSVFPVGTTLIEYEVMDGCGQVAYCNFSVQVVDENPVSLSIDCPNNIRLHIVGQDTTVTWDLPEIVSACNEEAVSYTQVLGPALGETFPIGSTRITYKVEDACQQVQYCSFIVEVIQGLPTPLVVECPENISITLPFGIDYSQINWRRPQIVSFCSEDLVVSQIEGPPSGGLFWEGNKTITYFIQDGCGNRQYCTFELEVKKIRGLNPEVEEMSSSTPVQEVLTYPNPTSGKLNLTWQNLVEEHLELEIVNLLGQVCHRQAFRVYEGQNNLQLELNDLAAGCYFWRLRSEKGWKARRQFIKQ